MVERETHQFGRREFLTVVVLVGAVVHFDRRDISRRAGGPPP